MTADVNIKSDGEEKRKEAVQQTVPSRLEEGKTIRRIGVLTSGGDAPGMNAAIRSVVRASAYYGIDCYGVRKGYEGLLAGDLFKFNIRAVSDIIQRGGTILQTARCKEFSQHEYVLRGRKMAEVFKLDALVVIGGDGSFRGALDLAREGLPVIGIPGTIDNDIGCTDYTIGYDTAMNTVAEAIDKLKDTACSHDRCTVVEVMGRNAGYIALSSAVAGGAEVCLLPERGYDLGTDIIKPLVEGRNRGKHHYVVIVAEGVGGTLELAKQIKDITGVATTATILGHVQRGGAPSVKDRVTASLMGVKAMQCLSSGKINQIIAMKGEECVAFDIEEALATEKTLDEFMLFASGILTL